MRRMKRRSKVVVFKYRQENLGDSLYCRLPAEYHSLHRFPGWPPGRQWRHPDHWVKGTGSLVSLSWTTHALWATENKYTSSQYMQKRTLTEKECSSHCARINQMSELKIQKNTEKECSSHCARINQMSDLKIQKNTEKECSSHCARINQMSDLKIQKNTEKECSSHCARINQMFDLKIQKNTEKECSSHCARINQISDLKIQKKCKSVTKKTELGFVDSTQIQFCTKSSVQFNVALRPQRLYKLLGMGSSGWPPQLSQNSWAL